MSKTKNFDALDREKRIHKVEKGKNKIDKHRKFIYNYASSSNIEDDDAYDEILDYALNQRIKRR